MKDWMWLALIGGAALWYFTRNKNGQTPQAQEPEGGPPQDYIEMPRTPPAGDEQMRDVGSEVVTQLYGYSVAPRADQVHKVQRGTH